MGSSRLPAQDAMKIILYPSHAIIASTQHKMSLIPARPKLQPSGKVGSMDSTKRLLNRSTTITSKYS